MCVVDTTDLELFDSETDFPNFLIFTPQSLRALPSLPSSWEQDFVPRGCSHLVTWLTG